MRQDVTGFFTMLQGDRARGGVEIRARGVGWDSGPGREVWIRAPGAGWGGFRAGARGGNYLG